MPMIQVHIRNNNFIKTYIFFNTVFRMLLSFSVLIHYLKGKDIILENKLEDIIIYTIQILLEI